MSWTGIYSPSRSRVLVHAVVEGVVAEVAAEAEAAEAGDVVEVVAAEGHESSV